MTRLQADVLGSVASGRGRGHEHVGELAVVLLEYVREDSTLGRVLTVLKTRASHHEPESREYTIIPDGIVLGSAIAPDSAV